jgi:hypothetical protein
MTSENLSCFLPAIAFGALSLGPPSKMSKFLSGDGGDLAGAAAAFSRHQAQSVHDAHCLASRQLNDPIRKKLFQLVLGEPREARGFRQRHDAQQFHMWWGRTSDTVGLLLLVQITRVQGLADSPKVVGAEWDLMEPN